MMNTITKSASTNVIVAVDLGKYKSVACVHEPATGEYRFTTFETTRAADYQPLAIRRKGQAVDGR
jgi:hypothetical protein